MAEVAFGPGRCGKHLESACVLMLAVGCSRDEAHSGVLTAREPV